MLFAHLLKHCVSIGYAGLEHWLCSCHVRYLLLLQIPIGLLSIMELLSSVAKKVASMLL
jgi:hypothetical protein